MFFYFIVCVIIKYLLEEFNLKYLIIVLFLFSPYSYSEDYNLSDFLNKYAINREEIALYLSKDKNFISEERDPNKRYIFLMKEINDFDYLGKPKFLIDENRNKLISIAFEKDMLYPCDNDPTLLLEKMNNVLIFFSRDIPIRSDEKEVQLEFSYKKNKMLIICNKNRNNLGLFIFPS